eukprot:g1499.t1
MEAKSEATIDTTDTVEPYPSFQHWLYTQIRILPTEVASRIARFTASATAQCLTGAIEAYRTHTEEARREDNSRLFPWSFDEWATRPIDLPALIPLDPCDAALFHPPRHESTQPQPYMTMLCAMLQAHQPPTLEQGYEETAMMRCGGGEGSGSNDEPEVPAIGSWGSNRSHVLNSVYAAISNTGGLHDGLIDMMGEQEERARVYEEGLQAVPQSMTMVWDAITPRMLMPGCRVVFSPHVPVTMLPGPDKKLAREAAQRQPRREGAWSHWGGDERNHHVYTLTGIFKIHKTEIAFLVHAQSGVLAFAPVTHLEVIPPSELADDCARYGPYQQFFTQTSRHTELSEGHLNAWDTDGNIFFKPKEQKVREIMGHIKRYCMCCRTYPCTDGQEYGDQSGRQSDERKCQRCNTSARTIHKRALKLACDSFSLNPPPTDAYGLYQRWVWRLDMCSHCLTDWPFPQRANSATNRGKRTRTASEETELVAEQECPICMDKQSGPDKVIMLNGCRHTFHLKCICKYLKEERTPKCPTCRAAIKIGDCLQTRALELQIVEPEMRLQAAQKRGTLSRIVSTAAGGMDWDTAPSFMGDAFHICDPDADHFDNRAAKIHRYILAFHLMELSLDITDLCTMGRSQTMWQSLCFRSMREHIKKIIKHHSGCRNQNGAAFNGCRVWGIPDVDEASNSRMLPIADQIRGLHPTPEAWTYGGWEYYRQDMNTYVQVEAGTAPWILNNGTRIRKIGSDEEQIIGMQHTTSEIQGHGVSEEQAMAQALEASTEDSNNALGLSLAPLCDTEWVCQIASLEKRQLKHLPTNLNDMARIVTSTRPEHEDRPHMALTFKIVHLDSRKPVPEETIKALMDTGAQGYAYIRLGLARRLEGTGCVEWEVSYKNSRSTVSGVDGKASSVQLGRMGIWVEYRVKAPRSYEEDVAMVRLNFTVLSNMSYDMIIGTLGMADNFLVPVPVLDKAAKRQVRTHLYCRSGTLRSSPIPPIIEEHANTKWPMDPKYGEVVFNSRRQEGFNQPKRRLKLPRRFEERQRDAPLHSRTTKAAPTASTQTSAEPPKPKAAPETRPTQKPKTSGFIHPSRRQLHSKAPSTQEGNRNLKAPSPEPREASTDLTRSRRPGTTATWTCGTCGLKEEKVLPGQHKWPRCYRCKSWNTTKTETAHKADDRRAKRRRSDVDQQQS